MDSHDPPEHFVTCGDLLDAGPSLDLNASKRASYYQKLTSGQKAKTKTPKFGLSQIRFDTHGNEQSSKTVSKVYSDKDLCNDFSF